MKFIVSLVFTLSFFFQNSFSEAQNQDSIFVSCKRWGGDIEVAENWKWKINNVEFKLTLDTIKIPIYQTDFDTILFTNESEERIILTKFNKGHVYNIHYNACCSDFDIVEKNDYYDSLEQIEDIIMSYYIHTREPRVRFELLNGEPNDNLVGVLGNFYYDDTIHGEDLHNNKKTSYLSPATVSFAAYNYNLGMVRRAKQLTTKAVDNDKAFYVYFYNSEKIDYYKIEKIFQMIEYRFFGKEKLLVTYDYQTNKMKVEIEN